MRNSFEREEEVSATALALAALKFEVKPRLLLTRQAHAGLYVHWENAEAAKWRSSD